MRDQGLDCEAFIDGMAVRVDDQTVYEPDVLIRGGEPLRPDAIHVADPVSVVEVLSPSTRSRDSGAKLEDYFRLPSVQHYLLIKTDTGSIIHHFRDASGLRTAIARTGEVECSPPGIRIPVSACFPRERG